MWIALLLLTGVLLGGVASFARARQWLVAVVLLVAAGLSFAAAMAWAPR